MTTTYWSPNQATVAQIETYTFTAPSGVGNTYNAAINGKTITYTSVSGDTATTVATALFNLLNNQSGLAPEFAEITWTNPSNGVIVATAQTPGTPFANVTVNGVAEQGLVMSTGNGLANGIATVHTRANKSPSDIADAQNWLRVTTPAPGVRQLPQAGDDVVVSDTNIPMLWNLDHLASTTFATYTRYASMTGNIGLAVANPNGYAEWRAPYFRFIGPAGSAPAGGLAMILGIGATGSHPPLEQYNVGSQKVTLTVLGGNTIHFLGVHTDNTLSLLGAATLNVAAQPGEIATLTNVTVDGNALLVVGPGVTWTAGTTLTILGGTCQLFAAPAAIDVRNNSTVSIMQNGLTWTSITMQGNCTLFALAGGIITTLTMSQGCLLDKSSDTRTLTITNSTIDGDTCQIIDPLNAITYTNATTVKQQVTSGPFTFTGTRTVRII